MTTTTHAPNPVGVRPRASWGLLPAAGVSASAVLLFGVQIPLAGYAVLVLSVAAAFFVDRALFRDLVLIALGLGIISTISLEANISYPNMALMGAVLTLAVLVPYLLSRYLYHDHAIRIVVMLGYLILPIYFIGSGSYQNWPAVTQPDEIARLFVGVNAVGIWDELFFICVTFTLLRRHFPDWQANLLQAVIFVSFLWELGYQSWGPLMTFPFALLQGFTFKLTKSLTYVVCVHLLFDLVVFLVIVHAHSPEWLPIFLFSRP